MNHPIFSNAFYKSHTTIKLNRYTYTLNNSSNTEDPSSISQSPQRLQQYPQVTFTQILVFPLSDLVFILVRLPIIFVICMVWIVQICLFYPHLSTLLLDLAATRPLSPFTCLCVILRPIANYIDFALIFVNSIWGKGLLLFCFLNCFLCVCPLPMMWIHCWVYIYIPIFQWWVSLFFGCLLFLPSIFLMPMECIFFFLYGAIFHNTWLSEIQSFLTKYTLKISFYFKIKSKAMRNKLKFSLTHDYYL